MQFFKRLIFFHTYLRVIILKIDFNLTCRECLCCVFIRDEYYF